MPKKTNKQFLEQVYNKVKNDYTFKEEYVSAKTKIKVTHNTCDFTFTVSPDNFLNNNTRCPKCSGNFKNDELFKKEINDLVGNEYSLLETYKTKRHKLLFIHNECGTSFKQHPENFLKGHRCPTCGLQKRSKENHYKYNPDLTTEDRMKRDMFNGEIRKWRERIFKRDNYTCQICGSYGNKLNAHHLNSWDKYINQRFEDDNGITLCDSCHKSFHKRFGYGNNTSEQFMEFVKK